MFLKIQLYYNYNPEDIDSVTMHYVPTQFEVIKGLFNLNVEEIIQLAAIQFYVDYGSISHDDIFRQVSTEIRRSVPCNKLFHIDDGEVTVDKIIESIQ